MLGRNISKLQVLEDPEAKSQARDAQQGTHPGMKLGWALDRHLWEVTYFSGPWRCCPRYTEQAIRRTLKHLKILICVLCDRSIVAGNGIAFHQCLLNIVHPGHMVVLERKYVPHIQDSHEPAWAGCATETSPAFDVTSVLWYLCRHTLNDRLTSSHTYKNGEKRHPISCAYQDALTLAQRMPQSIALFLRRQAWIATEPLSPSNGLILRVRPVRSFHLWILRCFFGGVRPSCRPISRTWIPPRPGNEVYRIVNYRMLWVYYMNE